MIWPFSWFKARNQKRATAAALRALGDAFRPFLPKRRLIRAALDDAFIAGYVHQRVSMTGSYFCLSMTSNDGYDQIAVISGVTHGFYGADNDVFRGRIQAIKPKGPDAKRFTEGMAAAKLYCDCLFGKEDPRKHPKWSEAISFAMVNQVAAPNQKLKGVELNELMMLEWVVFGDYVERFLPDGH